MATRREWIEAIADRYHAAARAEKKVILDEFINVTGFHCSGCPVIVFVRGSSISGALAIGGSIRQPITVC